jgi:hypothetical protein
MVRVVALDINDSGKVCVNDAPAPANLVGNKVNRKRYFVVFVVVIIIIIIIAIEPTNLLSETDVLFHKHDVATMLMIQF